MVSFKRSAIRTANNCNLLKCAFFVYIVSKSSVDGLVRTFFTPLCFSGDVTPPPRVWSKKQRYVIVMGFKNKSRTCTCVQMSRFDCHSFICNLKPLQETSKTNDWVHSEPIHAVPWFKLLRNGTHDTIVYCPEINFFFYFFIILKFKLLVLFVVSGRSNSYASLIEIRS